MSFTDKPGLKRLILVTFTNIAELLWPVTCRVRIRLEASSEQAVICAGCKDSLILGGAPQRHSAGLLSMHLPESTTASQSFQCMCVCELLNKRDAAGFSGFVLLCLLIGWIEMCISMDLHFCHYVWDCMSKS